MSSSRNQFEFIGNLGKEPEMKKLDNGQIMTKLFILTNETWKDKQTGKKQERSEAFGVVAYGNHAQYLANYARKGDKVLLKGKIRNNEWVDRQTGDKRRGFQFVISGFDSDVILFGKPIKNNNSNNHDDGDTDSYEYDGMSNGY